MGSLTIITTALHQLSDWRVLLDILVFTLIIYLLYRTLRATGTWQIVIGLTIAAIGAGVASLIGLRGVEWIFSNFSQVALISLLIIFQPEIRKILERTTSLIRVQSKEETVGMASVISDLLFALAKKKWGAILVIPGMDSVKQWISEGIKIDAVPSFSLLMSIFDPGSPGHDGAVIISDGRIESFAVRLPISQVDSLPETMGTRHNASQSLSKLTDALVMTVSEERGVVSFFEKGKITVISEPQQAIEKIVNHGMQHDSIRPSPSTDKRLLGRTMLEAGACFLIAALFWVTVIMNKTQVGDMIFTVPVQYTNLQNHLVLEGDIPQEVKLHLEGPISTLTTLDLSLMKVLVDLADIGEGEQSIELTDRNAQVGKKVKILDIIPSTLDLKIKPLHKALMPIEVQLIGNPQAGFEVQSIEIVPHQLQVLISTPSEYSKDKSPQVLRTTPIYLNGLRSDTTVYCKIVSPPGVQPAERRWPDIEVRIKIQQSKNAK